MLSSVLLNPTVRVYTLRFLLIATVPTIYVSMTAVRAFDTLDPPSYRKGIFGLAMGIIIWAHHILATFHWTLRGLAVIDLATVVIEMCCLVYLASTGSIESLDLRRISDAWLPSVLAFTIPPVVFLFLSLLFRITTIMATKEKLLAQRFSFLGSCELPSPLYTPASILLNRSLARPLVRGESKYIIGARAALLSCIGVGVPAFGIYSTMIKPAHATVSSIWIPRSSRTEDFFDLPGGKATISFLPYDEIYDSYPWNLSVTAFNPGVNVTINCPSPSDGAELSSPGALATCPCAWSDIRTISVSAVVPSGVISLAIGCDSGGCVGLEFPILLLPGSRLFGSLAWSRRQTISQSGVASGVIFSPEVSGLQQDTSAEGNITSLTLSVIPYPIRFFQDTADASVLSGISTFGGFWTFVNGTFALFFGANIIYFAFGRRPLSALGVVHLFQRRALVRNWYDDFPAIQTEGGLPGSENAGIVAFIRERLVDLGEDPRDIKQKPRVKKVPPKSGKFRRAFPWRKKIQRSNSRVQRARPSSEESDDSYPIHITASPNRPPSTELHDFREDPHARSRRGYILDEIPLLDIDLGLSDISSQPKNIEGTPDIGLSWR